MGTGSEGARGSPQHRDIFQGCPPGWGRSGGSQGTAGGCLGESEILGVARGSTRHIRWGTVAGSVKRERRSSSPRFSLSSQVSTESL